MTDEAFQTRQRGKYATALANLMPGTRDAGLVTVTLYGRQAGMTPDELYADIMANAPGATRPNPSAVRRAIEHAARTVELGGVKDWAEKNRASAPATAYDRIWKAPKEPTAAEKREAARRALPPNIRGTVARLVIEGRGATSKSLRAMSPTAIPSAPAEQAAAHLTALGADWRWPIWAGTIGAKVPGGKRGGICYPDALADTIRAGLADIPTHVSLNPLTGKEGRTKDGLPSFDCAATVAAFPFALLEFDAMPLDGQCALFAALIRRKPGRVVSICYSGGKSLHGVILIPEAFDRRGETLPPLTPLREDRSDEDDQKWRENMDALVRLFASSDDPAERIDLAPTMNPAVHTRLAGAFRADKGKRQTLLYLDAALARQKLEIF
ncbi:MAG: hypothetical protein IIZ06_05485 [Kiritimatiellae bacterium]|nr:hypothetical protein [Kiritimatiellia bacterium]